MSKLINVNGYEGPERRNGESRKIMWWVISLFTALVLGGGSAWANGISYQINAIRTELSTREGRISKNEAVGEAIRGRLDRLDNKMDKIIELIAKRRDG